jgi:hypothetical protein|tara:strand:+ start:288 stop:1046 length:759 start_codon:yes stop_codon:yes gene_type:complete
MDQFIGGGFTWFTGEIVDINDPLLSNRVRVMPFGYYDNTIPSDKLPWSTVMMPNTSSSFKGYGSNHELMVGSWVVGFFRDGQSAQDAIVMGSIASSTNSIIDIPVEAQLNPPTNKVHKTEAGHMIEIDNTPSAERINIKHKDDHTFSMTGAEIQIRHKSGTVININEEGTVLIDAVNDIVNIDGNTTITGTLTVSDATSLQSTLAVTSAQTNNSTIVASGEVTGNGIKLSDHKHEGSPTASSGPKSDTGKPV